MHDPMTVAHRFFLPVLGEVIIWHVDPERDRSDDSCDWFGHRKTKENGWWPAAVDDYKSMDGPTRRAVDFVWWQWHEKLTGRPWWRHPRWHLRHWRLQVQAWSSFNRWAWSRCAGCGKRFPWGYAPISSGWGSGGAKFGKGESGVYHFECHGLSVPALSTAGAEGEQGLEERT